MAEGKEMTETSVWPIIPHSRRVGPGCYTKPTPPNCGFFAPTKIADYFDGLVRTCFFYEDKGRDRVDRPHPWRVCFYYASHFAITKMFATEADKNGFLASLPKESE
jgi:hypothetical protein